MPEGHSGVFRHVLLPVNGVDDARATTRAIEKHEPGRVTAVYVVKRTSGPEAVPLSKSEEIGRDSFGAIHERFPEADSRIVRHEDVAEGILEVAQETETTSIVFVTRSNGGILSRLFSANISEKLVDTADRPVLVLPTED